MIDYVANNRILSPKKKCFIDILIYRICLLVNVFRTYSMSAFVCAVFLRTEADPLSSWLTVCKLALCKNDFLKELRREQEFSILYQLFHCNHSS